MSMNCPGHTWAKHAGPHADTCPDRHADEAFEAGREQGRREALEEVERRLMTDEAYLLRAEREAVSRIITELRAAGGEQ